MEHPMDLYSNDKSYSGWWYTYPSKKNEFVSWAYEIPKMWKNKIHVPNHQPVNGGLSISFHIYVHPMSDNKHQGT
jgi:hypothetical protein